MFYLIIVAGWGAGFAAYIALNKYKNYNTFSYYSVDKKYRKYKRLQDNLNDKK